MQTDLAAALERVEGWVADVVAAERPTDWAEVRDFSRLKEVFVAARDAENGLAGLGPPSVALARALLNEHAPLIGTCREGCGSCAALSAWAEAAQDAATGVSGVEVDTDTPHADTRGSTRG